MKNKVKKLSVGITGGIGSGKSSVCEVYRDNNYKILDADAIAKEVMLENTTVKEQIIEAFGENAYLDDNINRKYLADIVFSDKEKLDELNNIVHPPTIERIKEEIEDAFLKEDIVFVESAILYEAKMHKLFDYVIYLLVDDELKIERTVKRDGVSEVDVEKRMDNQMPDSEKYHRADFVIENNGDIVELRNKAIFFLNVIEAVAYS